MLNAITQALGLTHGSKKADRAAAVLDGVRGLGEGDLER
jgi:hypothetical protein